MRSRSPSCALILLLSLSESGCGQLSAREGIATALVAVGATAVVAGVLEAAGCDKTSASDPGCSGGPEDADLAGGFAAAGVGAALIAAGLAVQPPQHKPLFLAPPPPLPVMRGPLR